MKKLFGFIVVTMALLTVALSTKPFEFNGPSDFYYGLIFGVSIGLDIAVILLYKIIKSSSDK